MATLAMWSHSGRSRISRMINAASSDAVFFSLITTASPSGKHDARWYAGRFVSRSFHISSIFGIPGRDAVVTWVCRIQSERLAAFSTDRFSGRGVGYAHPDAALDAS